MRKYRNIIGIKAILIATFLLLASLNLSAQYKLELEWQKQPGGNGFEISSLLSYDSLVLVTGEGKAFLIDSSGTIRKEFTPKYFMGKLAKTNTKGQIFATTSESSLGIFDVTTLDFIYKIDETQTQKSISGSYQNEQNKILSYGLSSNQFIKLYDVSTRKMIKELDSNYFPEKEKYIRRANLTNDGKYIVYSTWNRVLENGTNWVDKYYLKIIDVEGNNVYNFGEVGYSTFGFTYDQKQLIYYQNKNINFFDLETLKVNKNIFIQSDGGGNLIIPSQNNKFILFGNLSYLDLINQEPYKISQGTWSQYLLLNDSNIISAGGPYLQKFNLKLINSVNPDDRLSDYSLTIQNNKLILTNPQNHQINTLTVYDILGRTYPLSANRNEVDIRTLATGKYFLKVGLADGSFLDFGFIKGN